MSQIDDKRRNDGDDLKLAARAKALFDESVSAVDGQTQSRLTKARHLAIESARSGAGRRQLWTQWAPATGVAAAAAVAVVMWNTNTAVDIPSSSVVSDIEILLTEDDFDMLENLEFYSWLEFNGETDEHGNVI